MAAVIAGVLVSGGDDDGASPNTTSGATPTDPFFEVLSQPTDVIVTALGDGSFEVSYVAPEGVAFRSIGAAGRVSTDIGPVCSS